MQDKPLLLHLLQQNRLKFLLYCKYLNKENDRYQRCFNVLNLLHYMLTFNFTQQQCYMD